MATATLRKCVIVEQPARVDSVLIARDLLDGAVRRVMLRGKQRLLASRYEVGDEIYAQGLDDRWRLITVTSFKQNPGLLDDKYAVDQRLAEREP